MRISNTQQVARPQFYDRNPTDNALVYQAGGLAPHAATTRWSYTVPVGKKAWWQTGYAYTRRESAAAPAAITRFTVAFNVGAGGVIIANAISVDNTVNAPYKDSLSSQVYMGPGHVLSGTSEDLSTGGTMTMVGTASYTEFDA